MVGARDWWTVEEVEETGDEAGGALFLEGVEKSQRFPSEKLREIIISSASREVSLYEVRICSISFRI